MFIKEYIDSGILELYVAGALSEKECQEVYQLMLTHPEIKDEIENIESTIMELTSATSPGDSKHNFGFIKKHLTVEKEKIREKNEKARLDNEKVIAEKEKIRIENEKAVAEKENIRVANEKAIAEKKRIENDKVIAKKEQARLDKEKALAEKEKLKVTKESVRVEKEPIDSDNIASKVIPLNKKSKTNWFVYTSWIATILFGAGLIWLGNENNNLSNKNNQLSDEINQLKNKENSNDSDQKFLELEIEKININLENSKKLISIFRNRNIISVSLAGQTIAPKSYAKVYWDKKNKTIYLDAQGLPNPPEGKVYQLWSLTLEPFTSKNLGTLDDFNSNDDKIFTIPNSNASQAFGITLEPEGGSSVPTLNQLYTLGIV